MKSLRNKLPLIATLVILVMVLPKILLHAFSPIHSQEQTENASTMKAVKDPNPAQCGKETFHYKGRSQDDPLLIKYIKDELLVPPVLRTYNLTSPERIHFSQFGESEYAEKHFTKGKREGVFIEVGGYDGETFSNSLYYERQLAWRGVLIEPHYFYKTLVTKNRNAYRINVALSTTKEADDIRIQGDNSGSKQVEKGGTVVKAMPLYSIMEALDMSTVDFFSLDVEGFELKVLQTLPWDKVRFNLLCVEYHYIPQGLPKLTEFMISKGYTFLGKHRIDAFYGWPDNKTNH